MNEPDGGAASRPGEESCAVCSSLVAGDDRAAGIVHRGERCFARLSTTPYNSGHLLLSPYRHVDGIEGLEGEVLLELMTLARHGLGVLRELHRPDGFNLGLNEGSAAAGSQHHAELHVVPRFTADTGFVAAIGGARVIPQSLSDSYLELCRAFERAAAGTSSAA